MISAPRRQLVDILADEKIDTKLVVESPSGSRTENPTTESKAPKVVEDEVEEWQFSAQLNNMKIKDHAIVEGEVYEYQLPDALIPLDDILEERKVLTRTTFLLGKS